MVVLFLLLRGHTGLVLSGSSLAHFAKGIKQPYRYSNKKRPVAIHDPKKFSEFIRI